MGWLSYGEFGSKAITVRYGKPRCDLRIELTLPRKLTS